MKQTVFKVPKMDCPSEESMIRMKLSDYSAIKKLAFDIPNRMLTVWHEGKAEEVQQAILSLNFGGEIVSSVEVEEQVFAQEDGQSKLLWSVLIINFVFFLVEMTFGWFSQSMGLISDSLDMLADSFVYGISLFAVGKSVALKKKVAKTAGVFQIVLALVGFIEVLRRFFGAEEYPDFKWMIGISFLALLANWYCLVLLQKSKNNNEAHMQASMIFTSNDIVINIGVMLAGVLVYFTHTMYPDLIIGAIVFLIVLKGAFNILKLSK